MFLERAENIETKHSSKLQQPHCFQQALRSVVQSGNGYERDMSVWLEHRAEVAFPD